MRRNQRLRRPDQFARVRRNGKTWAHSLFILNVARNRVGHNRCGFVVGKQVGKAHDRNRAKRRVREAVRLLYPQLAPGWDLIFIVRAPVHNASFSAITQAAQELLCRAGLWVTPDLNHESADASAHCTGVYPPLSTPLSSDSA